MNRSRIAGARHRLRGGRIGLVGAVLSFALVVTACSTVPGTPVAASNSGPFYAAVLDLLTQPVAHVVSPDSDGAGWDLRITSDGWSTGTATTGGQVSELFQTGSTSYVKPPPSVLASNLPRGKSVSALEGKWISGSDVLTAGVPGRLIPADVASALLTTLNEVGAFPRIGGPTVQIGSDQAYEVVTPKGTLAVSASEPYRLLRFVPGSDGASKPSKSTGPTTTAGSSGGGTSKPDPLADPLFFLVMSPAQRDQTYNDIVGQMQGLTSAVDIGVQYDFNSSGELKCSNDSCTVTSKIKTSTTTDSNARLHGGVATIMRAAITVDGTPSAGCSAAQTLPVNGSSSLTCTDASIAPLVAAIGARKQAEADAQSRAQGRSVTVEYVINYKASIDVESSAMIQADIDALAKQVRGYQDGARNKASCGPNCAYKQVPYNSDQLSQAANRARNADGTAPNSNIIVALVPGWNDPQTGDLVIGTGERQSDTAAGKSEAEIVSKLTGKGVNPDRITALYSERQPCLATCTTTLKGLKPDTPVSYTIPWQPDGPTVDEAGDELLAWLSGNSTGR